MKKFLLPFLLLTGLLAQSQPFNNSWINYSQTYYKFKVGATGLYKIKQSALASISIQNTPVEQFQVWRNGQQIPIYTSIQSGVMGAGDYIEFWGEMNDGKPDKPLYRVQDYQLNDKYSFETDTAAYFLTIHTTISENKRLVPTVSTLPSALTPEPYFMYTVGKYYREKVNLGIGYPVGSNLYSAAYDSGEGWTSNDLGAGATRAETFANLFAYTAAGAPAPIVKSNLCGNWSNPRQVEVQINGNQLALQTMDFWDYLRVNVPTTVAQLSSGSATIQIINKCAVADRLVIAQTELVYARQFNFGGADNFQFELPAKSGDSYLEIAGFNSGGYSPVLYDLTNGKRYVCDATNPALLKVVLQSSSVSRKLVLVTQAPAFAMDVTSFQQRNFVNYALAANQGNYLMIVNEILTHGPNGTNPIADYKAYRSSIAGGSYNAKVYMIDQLIDQFAFGIKIHPESIRNFSAWARNTFTQPIKDVLLFGKGVRYDGFRYYEGHPLMDKLNLVPTFGLPASDVLLTANPGLDQIPQIPIGRISAINGQEVADYLSKVIQYEQQQAFSSPLISDKAWMKNVVHVVGASDASLQIQLDQSMASFKKIIADTFYGARVSSFSKTSTDPVEQSNSLRLQNLFQEGIGIITYFGHSSATTLEYNLDNPQAYNNPGKYPVFILLGCQAGNLFNFNLARLDIKETISEKFVLAQDRGGIASIASTSLGIVHYLDINNSENYNAISKTKYGGTLGEVMKEAIIKSFNITTQGDPYNRMQLEGATLHGDPAVRLNSSPKPDYVIEAPNVKISPSFITVGDANFKVDASILNIGKAISKKTIIEVKRTYPDLTTEIVERDTIAGIRFSDSLSYLIRIYGTKDKGLNKITVTVDPDNEVDELYENNNSITKEFFIYENEARPVSPYNYSIVNKQGIKFYASTADPFNKLNQYNLEIDTTMLFNSALKVATSISSTGGLLEFNPTITFIDGKVYYWRVAPVPVTGQPNWNTASFIYMANHVEGSNQSHYFQHLESKLTDISLNSQRKWAFDSVFQNIFARNTIYPEGGTQVSEFTVSVNGNPLIGGGCNYNAIIFNVFHPNSLVPWKNVFTGGVGLYNSLSQACGGVDKLYNFEFAYTDSAKRADMMNFLQNVVPDGYYVVARGNIPAVSPIPPAYIDVWKTDQTYYGAGKSLYHIFKNEGISTIDSFYKPRTFIFAYRKNSQGGFVPKQIMGESIYDKLTLDINIKTSDTTGYIESPLFGIAKNWKMLEFKGASLPEPPGSDSAKINIIGINRAGQEVQLVNNIDPATLTYDISSINAADYPYIKLKLFVKDATSFSPYQLDYWRVDYDPVPEGVIAPNLFFKVKDTVDVGEPVDFKVAFKNVTNIAFTDSMKVKISITDKDNLEHIIPLKHRKLLANPDSIHVGGIINTESIPGLNIINLETNPNNDQAEQYHFNNFAFRNLYVRPDSLSPLMDVTFDGQHILNRDLVSSKPDIIVKLKDEAKWMSLNDTSLLTMQVRFPNGSIRRFYFNNDTLRFNAAGMAPTTDNTATINFKPYFTEDGDYELIVSGNDRSENKAGNIEYRVMFQVVNKPMISNMLNYPNPFTTSTAFVFTITGSEVPQNIKIEIMTITGKIVREITKEELGPLQVGRNITQFKWDGTDQYGQKLANGIYLYRVITNLNGKSLDKYKSKDDNTDKYFNKGYGKMYLMR